MAEQQEEFKLPVKKTWIDVQKKVGRLVFTPKTFTGWANSFLTERMLKIADLEVDLDTGILLINLLEEISSKKIPGYNKNPKMRIQKVENNNKAIQFITQEGLKLVGIGAEDIVDHKLKLILGLIWTLILRYQIQQGSGDDSPKKALLEWVNNQIRPYGIQVNNFIGDWQDARALSALCDSLSPGVLLQGRDLNGVSGNAFKDADKAMDVAEAQYEIPKILDPADLVELPEELSIITYVSYYRDWLEKKADKEAQRLLRAAYAAYCFAYGPGLEGALTGEPANFTIQAVNVYEDKLGHGGETFKVDITLNGSDEKVVADVKDAGNGTYPVTYTALLPGDYTVLVTLNGEKIKDMPVTVKVIGADAGNCNAFGPGLQGANVGKPAPFKIAARNALGEPLKNGGDKFVVTVSGPEDLGEQKVVDNGDGTYDCVYNPTKRGTYTVKITLRGDEISNSPIDVLCQSGVAENSWADGPGIDAPVKSHHPAVFTIHSVDIDGKPVTDGGDPFKVAIIGPDVLEADVKDNNDGTYTVTYEPKKAGDYEVNVTLHDEPIKDMPKLVQVLASPDAGKSYAEGPGLENPSTHHPQNFTIHAIDHDGHPRTDGGDEFVVKLSGPEEIVPPVKDNGDGTYSVEYTPTKAGEYKVDITYENNSIKDMPRTLEVKATPDAGQSYAEGPGLEKPNTHHEQTFTIHAVDHDGNPRTTGGDEFKVVLNGPETIEPPVVDNGDGTYTVKYTAEKSGDYNVDVTYEGAHIKDMPRNLFIEASPDAGKSYAEGPGLEKPNTHHEQNFTIHAIDAEGNPRKTGGDEFKVTIKGPEELQAAVKDNGDGTYGVTYTATKSGDYEVDITFEDAHIKDMPKTVFIEASPSAANSYAEGPGLENPNTHHEQQFTIHAVDHDGNPRKTGGDEFKVAIKGPEELNPTVKDNGDGTYLVTYEATKAGDYDVDVTFEGEPIKDMPKKVAIRASPDASKTYADGPGLEKPNTHHPQEFTVHAVDHDGNPLTQGGDNFDVTIKGPEEIKPEVIDNNDGTYTVKYEAAKPGDYEVDVQFEGAHIKDMPKTVFVNASPDAGQTWADGPGWEGGAPPVWQTKHEQTFTIHAVDHDGNPRKDGGDEFKVAISGPAEIAADVKDNGDGTYNVTYTPEAPGDYKIDVTFEGASIKDSPKEVQITAAPDSALTWAEGPGIEDGKVFDNEPTHFTIHAVDGSGQPRTSGGDHFDIKISGVEDIKPKVTDNNDGTYKVDYEVEEPGAYTIEVKYEGGDIKDAPFKINVKEGTDSSKSKAAFQLTVQAHDKRGNPKTFGGDKFTVALVQGAKTAGNKVKADIDTFDNGDGSYTAKYTIEGEGSFKLAVKINGHHVDGSPFNQERGVPKKK